MKIVHLTSAHPALDIRIFEKECSSLAAAGHDVTLIAVHPRDEVVRGVRILGVERPAGRLARMTTTAKAVYRRALGVDADVYHFHDPELLPYGIRLQRQTAKPAVYDAHEYLSMDISDKAWVPMLVRKPLSLAAGAFERWAVKRVAGVVAVNPHMADLFRPTNDRVTVVANYPGRRLAEDEVSLQPEPDSIVYVGVLCDRRGYELMIEAMKLLRRNRPGAYCRVIGRMENDGLPANVAALTNEDLAKVGMIMAGSIPYAEIPGAIARHSVGWLPWKRCSANLYGTPTKLLEYMAIGRPVVASDLPFVRRIIEDAKCGLLVPPDKPEAHAEALQYLMEHPEEAARMGANGRKAILTDLNWEAQVPPLIALYERILRERSGSASVPEHARSAGG